MRVIFHGDRCRQGRYLCHSRFSSHVNFRDGENFIFLTHRLSHRGPCTIGVSPAINLESTSLLELAGDALVLDGVSLSLSHGEMYRSHLDFNEGAGVGRLVIDRARRLLGDELAHYKFSHPMVGIVRHQAPPAGSSPFEKIVWQKLADGLSKLSSDAGKDAPPLAAVALLKGVGSGLTPSGDDMIAGALFATHFLDHATGGDSANLRESLLAAARREDPFVNHFLALASAGAALEPVGQLLRALMHGDVALVRESLQELAHLGATSGIDLCLGLWAALAF